MNETSSYGFEADPSGEDGVCELEHVLAVFPSLLPECVGPKFRPILLPSGLFCPILGAPMADPAVLTEGEILSHVRKAQEGDSAAFSALYEYFFPQVYRYAAFRFEREVAEDVVADVFVKVWEKLGSFQERKGVPFAAWLFRIARHEVIDVFRSHRPTDEVPEELHDPDTLNHADTHVKREDILKAVRTAMEKLPRRYRDILQLSYMGDLSISEVAQSLNIREGTVRVLKFRALQKLETLLPPETREIL